MRELLSGVRVVESSLLEPGALGMLLGELGAEVIKVEPPADGGERRAPGIAGMLVRFATSTTAPATGTCC